MRRCSLRSGACTSRWVDTASTARHRAPGTLSRCLAQRNLHFWGGPLTCACLCDVLRGAQAGAQERVLQQMAKRCALLEARVEALAPLVQQLAAMRESSKVRGMLLGLWHVYLYRHSACGVVCMSSRAWPTCSAAQHLASAVQNLKAAGSQSDTRFICMTRYEPQHPTAKRSSCMHAARLFACMHACAGSRLLLSLLQAAQAALQAAVSRAEAAEAQLGALAPSRAGELRQLQHDVQEQLSCSR